MTVSAITQGEKKLKDFDQETKRFRTIELQKEKDIPFGATLMLSDGRVYVAYISKHRGDHAFSGLSPAYSAGLNFGDEITQVNGKHVSDFGTLTDIYTMIDAATGISMDVNEKSMFTSHDVIIRGASTPEAHKQIANGDKGQDKDADKDSDKKSSQKGLSIGLDFNRQSVIVNVNPNGSAFLAGIKPGRMIVSVGGDHVVCSHPRSVVYVLDEAKRKINRDEDVTTQSLEVWTAPAKHLQLLYQVGNEMYQKVASSEYVHDFNFALDEGFDVRQAHDKNTNIMMQLTRRTSPLSIVLSLLND